MLDWKSGLRVACIALMASAAGGACGSDDQGGMDIGVADTGSSDTGSSDTGSADTTEDDTSAEDTSVDDTSVEDTSVEDTSVEDTSVEDTSVEDTSVGDTTDEDSTPDTDAEDEPDVEEPPLYTGAVTDPANSANISDFIDDEDVEDERAANPDAAFDGVVGELSADSSWTRVWYGEESGHLGREWRCSVQLSRVEVHAPDGGLLFASGETGRITLYGYNHDSGEGDITEDFDNSSVLAVKYVTGDTPPNPIVFDVDDLPAAGYVAHSVAFEVDLPDGSIHEITRVRVSEVVFRGECTTEEEDEIDWSTTEWTCPAECVAAVNNSTQTRSVWCERNGENQAHEDLCPAEKPVSEGEACVYECPYVLVYVGDYGFTYANDSGWLHEGNQTRRAGPLPHAVEHGSSVGAIEGKPCSILTTNPETRFVGISCSGGAASTYCAFQCLEPDAE
jgi:hypothetical protein